MHPNWMSFGGEITPMNVETYPTKCLARRIVENPSGIAELAIRNRIANGDAEYLAGRYAAALSHYLAAWNLIPSVAWPWLPRLDETVAVAEQLREIDLTAALLATSGARLASGSASSMGTQVVPPPAGLAAIARAHGVEPPSPGEAALDHGLELLAAGRHDQARRVLDAAAASERRGPLAAKLALARSAAALRGGRTADARTLVGDVTGDGLASMAAHLIAITHLREGNEPAARPHLERARSTWARSKKPPDEWTMIVPRSDGTPVMLPVAAPPPAGKVSIAAGVMLELEGDVEAQLEAHLAGRVGAQSLTDLQFRLESVVDVVAYLVHVRGWILPLSIGDCFAQLGEPPRARAWYLKARDYTYLNRAIELPMLWCRVAATYLNEGRGRYWAGDIAAALAAFQAIANVQGQRFELEGPAYEGAFATLTAVHRAFLEAGDLLDGRQVDGTRRTILAEAIALQRQIHAGLDFTGVDRDPHPIHPWPWLQQVARHLASQAQQAERSAIQFLEAAEREVTTRQLLEQDVAAQAQALVAEKRAIDVAKAQREVAKASVEVAKERADRIDGRIEDVKDYKDKLKLLDQLQAYLTGGWDDPRPIPSGYHSVIGLSSNSPTEHARDSLMRVAGARHAIHTAMELADLDRELAVAAAAEEEAEAQRGAAQKMVDLAEARRDLAALRAMHAEDRLASFEAELFTPEVWKALADGQAAIAAGYLAMALGAARRLERAFELEYDLELDVIRAGYATSYASGRLAADELLLDIERFTQLRLEQIERQLPVKVILPLAEQYPRAFTTQLTRTGRLDFQTHLRQLDELHPGLHLCKLRRVEVVFEGLLGPVGLHGTLRCAGFSEYRDRTGAARSRLQRPETMALSAYDLRRDGFVFATADQPLAPFENLGVATAWTLELSAEAADVDFGTISNVYLVLYLDGVHSDAVEQRVRAELAATAQRQHEVTFDVGAAFPDAFFALQDDGEVAFEITRAHLPWAHTDAAIENLYVAAVTADGVSREGLLIEVAAGGTAASGRTDADGLLGPLVPLHGAPFALRFVVRIPRTGNEAAFAAGFTWEAVTHLFVVARYTYQHRLRPEEQRTLGDDALTWFDIVDDPDATGGPSAWQPSTGALEQTSNLTAPVADAWAGTIALAKPWSGQRDQLIRAKLRSSHSGRIGVVVRAQGPDDHVLFVLDRPRKRRCLVRRRAGNATVLAEQAFERADDAYEIDRDYEVRVAAIGGRLVASVDGAVALVAADPAPGAGRVGLYCSGNRSARFTSLGFQRL